jgi:hypothetical protein
MRQLHHHSAVPRHKLLPSVQFLPHLQTGMMMMILRLPSVRLNRYTVAMCPRIGRCVSTQVPTAAHRTLIAVDSRDEKQVQTAMAFENAGPKAVPQESLRAPALAAAMSCHPSATMRDRLTSFRPRCCKALLVNGAKTCVKSPATLALLLYRRIHRMYNPNLFLLRGADRSKRAY